MPELEEAYKLIETAKRKLSNQGYSEMNLRLMVQLSDLLELIDDACNATYEENYGRTKEYDPD